MSENTNNVVKRENDPSDTSTDKWLKNTYNKSLFGTVQQAGQLM